MCAAIAKEFVYEKVTRHLAVRIMKGDCSSLPNESALGRELEVSRSVVSESIKLLAAKGLICTGTKNGIRIRSRKDWNLLDPQLLQWELEEEIDKTLLVNLSELRNICELKATELAVLRATEADIQEMRAAWNQMQCSRADLESYEQGHLRFHHGIFEAAHNELLSQVARLTSVSRGNGFPLKDFSDRFPTLLGSHKALLDAIAGRDPTCARNRMEEIGVMKCFPDQSSP